jgi:hypothetical protein
MTEAEWLTCDRAYVLLAAAKWSQHYRKVRLLACACCRAIWHHIDAPKLRAGIELSEAFADDPTKRAQIDATMRRNRGFLSRLRRSLNTSFGSVWPHADYIRFVCAEEAARAVFVHSGILVGVPDRIESLFPQQRSAQAALVRCLFGNPFRPVAFDPAWRTDTAVALARQMYDSREFGAMPSLADALQDAGCEDEQVLMHCRQPGPHARGCWVVDGVLGKA